MNGDPERERRAILTLSNKTDTLNIVDQILGKEESTEKIMDIIANGKGNSRYVDSVMQNKDVKGTFNSMTVAERKKIKKKWNGQGGSKVTVVLVKDSGIVRHTTYSPSTLSDAKKVEIETGLFCLSSNEGRENKKASRICNKTIKGNCYFTRIDESDKLLGLTLEEFSALEARSQAK